MNTPTSSIFPDCLISPPTPSHATESCGCGRPEGATCPRRAGRSPNTRVHVILDKGVITITDSRTLHMHTSYTVRTYRHVYSLLSACTSNLELYRALGLLCRTAVTHRHVNSMMGYAMGVRPWGNIVTSPVCGLSSL